MLLIGAGQLAEYLSTMAKFSGFAVTLCDPRAEYRTAWSMPGVAISTEMPDDAVIAFKPDRRSCVVALTHDPKLDDLALLEALQSEAFYVGAIGSRRNAAGAARTHDRALRPDRGVARAPARADRHLHRQQDAAGDRGERDGGDPGGEERRDAAARDRGRAWPSRPSNERAGRGSALAEWKRPARKVVLRPKARCISFDSRASSWPLGEDEERGGERNADADRDQQTDAANPAKRQGEDGDIGEKKRARMA